MSSWSKRFWNGEDELTVWKIEQHFAGEMLGQRAKCAYGYMRGIDRTPCRKRTGSNRSHTQSWYSGCVRRPGDYRHTQRTARRFSGCVRDGTSLRWRHSSRRIARKSPRNSIRRWYGACSDREGHTASLPVSTGEPQCSHTRRR